MRCHTASPVRARLDHGVEGGKDIIALNLVETLRTEYGEHVDFESATLGLCALRRHRFLRAACHSRAIASKIELRSDHVFELPSAMRGVLARAKVCPKRIAVDTGFSKSHSPAIAPLTAFAACPPRGT